jgi:hypothetical protein
MAKHGATSRFRFDLGFLLLWVVTYAAITAAILNCQGPYASEFLNRHVRISLAIGNTLLWAALWASSQSARQRKAEPGEPDADPSTAKSPSGPARESD